MKKVSYSLDITGTRYGDPFETGYTTRHNYLGSTSGPRIADAADKVLKGVKALENDKGTLVATLAATVDGVVQPNIVIVFHEDNLKPMQRELYKALGVLLDETEKHGEAKKAKKHP
jgi:hypothetical protein